MHRISLVIVFAFSWGLMISCSGTGTTTKTGKSQSKEIKKYPSWYSTQKVVSSDSLLYGYATAVAGDSATAVTKAKARAQAELKSYLSDKLESIRSEALAEKGSASGLNASRFMIALRKVDSAVGDVAQRGNVEAESIAEHSSYRGFAEVAVQKDKLIERIGRRLAGYEQAWNAMKASKAFQSF